MFQKLSGRQRPSVQNPLDTPSSDPGSARPCGRFAFALLLILTLPSSVQSQVVGDANGDGQFDVGDLEFAIDQLRFDLQPSNSLADVARPCDGTLRPADGQRLLTALRLGEALRLPSRCHSEPIGEAIARPPQSPRPPVTLDDRLLSVERQVPEFGGLYVEDGALRVYIVRSKHLVAPFHEALGAIEQVFGRDRFDIQSAQAVAGQYPFSRLLTWKGAAGKLLRAHAVTFVDADERRNRLRVGLRDLDEQPIAAAALARLGVPEEAIVFVERPLMKLHDALTDALEEKQRPLRGGLKIKRPERACTLGFLAKRYGLRGFVTNSHCVPPMGEVTFRTLFQPSAEPSNEIGFELVDPPFGCGGVCRSSDAAFFALEDGVTGRLGWLAGSAGQYVPYYGSYEIVGKGFSVDGERVLRVDFQSGDGSGEVCGTCVGLLADTRGVAGAQDVTELSCQTEYETIAKAGASGAAVFRDLGFSEAELLGVHWGSVDGVGGYSPIENIEWQLGTLDVTLSNEKPEIEIVEPADGSILGGGAFPVAELVAEVFDFENGGSCAACSVDWLSLKDGPLGSTGWSAGRSELDAVLGSGPGFRLIVATAKDPEGQAVLDGISVTTDNTPPAVWLDSPTSGATIYRGVPLALEASSFDSESFQALPCSALSWTVDGPSSASFPASGCFVTVSFEELGAHLLSVTGQDSKGLSSTATVTVQVIPPPLSFPPTVTFVSPAPGFGSAPGANVTVTAQVTASTPGPVALEWRLASSSLSVPGSFVVLGTGTVQSGATTALTFRPSDYLIPGSGGVPYVMVLRVTDAGGLGTGTHPLAVIWPPQ